MFMNRLSGKGSFLALVPVALQLLQLLQGEPLGIKIKRRNGNEREKGKGLNVKPLTAVSVVVLQVQKPVRRRSNIIGDPGKVRLVLLLTEVGIECSACIHTYIHTYIVYLQHLISRTIHGLRIFFS